MTSLDTKQQVETTMETPQEPTPRSIGRALSQWGAERPGRSALRMGDVTITYDELDHLTAQGTGGLRGIGVEKGERIAFLCPYRLDTLIALFSGYRVGAINVVLNEYLKGDALAHQLRDSAPSVLIVDAAGWDMAEPYLTEISDLRTVILLDEVEIPSSDKRFDTVPWRTLAEAEPFSEDVVDAAEPAQIVYTSGTTGLPKGCVLSHRYILHQGEVFGPWAGIGPDDTYMSSAPLYHVSGLHVLATGLIAGATVAVEPRFSASNFWNRVREVGATVFHGLGFATLALLRQPARPDDTKHTLRVFWSGAAPHEAKVQFEKRFAVPVIGGGYGQSEFNPVSMVHPDFPPDSRNSMGRPMDHVEVQLVDEQGNPVPEGTTGEIIVRPERPGVMFDGYWRQPEKTLETWTGLWHHTGDLARYDATGNLHFAGRVNDSMRRRGENVSAYEVEQAILKYRGVKETAVFGVRIDTEVDDCIKADLVMEDSLSFDPESFAAFINEALPYYAAPRFVELIDALPRNASGRIMKHELNHDVTVLGVLDLEKMGLSVSRSARRSSGRA